MTSKPLIDRIDHLVLTVADIEATTRFYERALGMQREFFRGPEGQPRNLRHPTSELTGRHD